MADAVTGVRAIAILGPTACGKSELALRLAERMPVELISVDSAQVYRGMDIGTAKPSAAERARVPHHLIDIRDPEQNYSAGEFRRDCLSLVEAIRGRGALPVLVGGTMLYFRALFQGIAALPVADEAVRAAIDVRAAREGWPALHAQLAVGDPKSAARIHPNDAQRIQRALEVLALSGRTLEQHWESASTLSLFGDWTLCVLEPQRREQLHERIAQRLDAMLKAGFTEEVSNLLARGTLDERSPALRLVGYRQMLGFCLRRETLQESAQKALFATRQLAKRQLTWLRSASFFPADAKLLKADPFDLPTMEQLPRALIEGM
ncbi:MAG TPA: tRNA (adenosine(37)-N6)-dimethylallyltransferase MiaA [Steroidobacteraceae bacterium]|nr:tRNA (adenosine(37)-N6)-dimethylallyltransferase MiaA [Steroidobacteraceae bacterium]